MWKVFECSIGRAIGSEQWRQSNPETLPMSTDKAVALGLPRLVEAHFIDPPQAPTPPLLKRIRTVYATYGAPRVHAELRAERA